MSEKSVHGAHLAHGVGKVVGPTIKNLQEKGGAKGAVGGAVGIPLGVALIGGAVGVTVGLPILIGAGILGAIAGAAGVLQK